MSLIYKIKVIKKFLGKKALVIMVKSSAIGILWFLIESSFIFIIQAFLISLKLIDIKATNLPVSYEYTPFMTFIALMLFGFFRSIIIFFKYYFIGISGQAITRHYRDTILQHAYLNYSKINSSEISFIYNEVVMSAKDLTIKVSSALLSLVAASLFVILALMIAPVELIISLIMISTLVYPLFLLDKRIKILDHNIYKISKDVNEHLSRGLKNIFLLKAYDQINNEVKKGFNLNQGYEKFHEAFYIIYSLKGALPILVGLFTISSVMYLSVTYFGGTAVKLISFFYIFIRLIMSFTIFLTAASSVKFKLKGLGVLLEIKENLKSIPKKEVPHKENKTSISQSLISKQNIIVSNLSFSYNENKVLNNFNAKVSASFPMILKGASGSGKSTFISLLLKVNKPDSGTILINDYNIHQAQESYSNSLAYVGPEPFLIPKSIKENLLYFYSKKNYKYIDLKIYDILKKVDLYEDILSLNKGINTILNEYTQLSTGQKQRLSIARAFLREPKVLILDEATANLDDNTEKKIIKLIEEHKDKMAIIIVTHKHTFDYFTNNIISL